MYDLQWQDGYSQIRSMNSQLAALDGACMMAFVTTNKGKTFTL